MQHIAGIIYGRSYIYSDGYRPTLYKMSFDMFREDIYIFMLIVTKSYILLGEVNIRWLCSGFTYKKNT